MNRFTALAVAMLLGSVSFLPIDAVAALVSAQGENESSRQENITNTTAAAFGNPVENDNALSGQKASSLHAVAFSGTAITSGIAPTVLSNDDVSTVPLPAAVWLFGSAFLGLCWLGRRSGMRGVGMLPKS